MSGSELTGQIIAAAMKIHTALGPGVLESAYEVCLEHELKKRGFVVERQKQLPITYDGFTVDCGYRIDLLVENEVIVELKAVDQLMPIHHAQLLSYLRIAKKEIGLLINFHEVRLMDGIARKINSLGLREKVKSNKFSVTSAHLCALCG